MQSCAGGGLTAQAQPRRTHASDKHAPATWRVAAIQSDSGFGDLRSHSRLSQHGSLHLQRQRRSAQQQRGLDESHGNRPADTNANGLPDFWESLYGITNPNGDVDGDGRGNLEEYKSGTNPTNAASFIEITGEVRTPDGHATINWTSIGGVRFRIQYSNDGLSGTFIDIIRPVADRNGCFPNWDGFYANLPDDFSLPGGAPAGENRFYRVKVIQ